MRSVIPIEKMLEFYQDSGNSWWLTWAANSCLASNEPLPDILREHLRKLTLRSAVADKQRRHRAGTQFVHEPYLIEMRDLIYLTGVTQVYAAELVAYLLGSEDPESPPTADTLLQWWKTRSARFRQKPKCTLTLDQARERIKDYLKIDATLEVDESKFS